MPKLFLLIGCLFVAKTAFAEPKFCQAQATSIQMEQDIVRPQWLLAWELHKRLATLHPNLVVSPLSIHETLSLAAAGARGKTQAQFQKVLGGTLVEPAWSNAAAAFKRDLACVSTEANVKVLLASHVFTQTGSTLHADWLAALARTYDAQPTQVDFLQAHPQAVQQINEWVETKTEGRITNLLAPAMVPRATKLLLANAVFLKAPWQKPFDPKRTRRAKFANRYDIEMMRTVGMAREFAYTRNPKFETVMAFTKDQQYAAVFFLPTSEHSLADLEKSLTARDLEHAIRNAKPELVDLSLPRFALMPALDLAKPLSAIGLDEAFTPGRADFRGINSSGGLSIEVFAHKALVQFNEAGFEAAAASAAVMASRSAGPQQRPIVLVIDRPFLFAIVHHRTRAPLFFGRVSQI